MICLANYRLILDKEKNNEYYVKSEEKSICPVCGCSELKVIGSRKRNALKEDGETIILIIRRLRCKNCRRIHHELPDILVPYKRYTSKVIEAILDGTLPEVCCENSSIFRIKKWFDKASEYIAGCLSAIAAQLSLEIKSGGGPASRRIKDLVGEATGWLARAVRTIVNTNNWIQTRSAFLT
jgi:hypothetical protein